MVALVGCCALVAGCGGSDEEEPGPETETTTTPPGSGSGGVALEEVGEFEQPVYVTQPPGDAGHLFVVERCGRVQRIPAAGGAAELFLDLSAEVTCEGTEQGLLSIAFAPDYERSGLLYVYFTDTAGTARIVEYRRATDGESADPASARGLLAIEDFASNHNGGLLAFGPDGLLYTGTGDGGGAGDPERTAQDPSSLLGKLLRIDPRPSGGDAYSIPASNPPPQGSGGRPEILAEGLRNPWRFSFDRETGDLWIGDVGQDSLEEIDSAPAATIERPPASLDFGWSAFEGSERFNRDQRAPGAIGPVLEYGRERGCSVTGGYVVRDPALGELFGRYLYGDYCEGELRSFTADAGAAARDDRPLGLTVPELSSFGEDAAGHVYAVSLAGPVMRLVGAGADGG